MVINPVLRYVLDSGQAFKYQFQHGSKMWDSSTGMLQKLSLSMTWRHKESRRTAPLISAVSFMLRPLYPQGKKPRYPLNRMLWSPKLVWMIGLQCILYFSSVSTLWHVFYGQLKCSVCWYKLTGFLNINSGHRGNHDSMWHGFHLKDRVLLITYKQQVCCAVPGYDIQMSQNLLCTYIVFMRNIPQTELSRVFANKIRHVDASLQATGEATVNTVVTSMYKKCTLF